MSESAEQPTGHPSASATVAESGRSDRRPDHPALADYRRRTRRSMRIYAGVLAVIVLLAFVAVRLAYAHGELVHVSGSTAPSPAPLPSGPVPSAGQLRPVWHSGDRAAGGNPYSDGIVVSFDAHTVSGRDALTGVQRWHYTRSDETICSVLQQDSSTIAVYDRHGNCDEVTGLTTATGAAKWYRTMTDDGPTTTASGPNVVLNVTAHTVHVIDNAGGLDRWDWTAPDGCTVTRALGGTLGVLIGLTCGSGHRLVLRELTTDSQKWSVNTAAARVPIAAGSTVAALDPATGTLYGYSTAHGAQTRIGQLHGVDPGVAASSLAAAATTVESLDAGGQSVEFCWFGALFSLSHNGVLRWTSAASGPGWLIGDSSVVAADGSGVAIHRISDGIITQRISLAAGDGPAPSGPFRTFPVGAGLLVAGSGVGYYR